MKKFLTLASIVALFLFSFTLLSEDEKASDNKKESKTSELSRPSNSTDSKENLEKIEKLDFSKIKESNESPDFDAHAGLD